MVDGRRPRVRHPCPAQRLYRRHRRHAADVRRGLRPDHLVRRPRRVAQGPRLYRPERPDRVVITDTLVPDVPILRYADEARARADTESATIDGYVVIPADYLQTGKLKAVALDSIPDVSEEAFEDFLRRSLIANAPSADA